MIIDNWKMDYDEYKGLECKAPCDMYSVLLDYGYIEDPYYGTNEEKLTSFSDKDCTFYTQIELSKDELAYDKIELNFYGLDTICDIYFNGQKLDSVMNMHRMYSYDIKSLAKKENEIRLEFKSPTKYFEKMENAHHIYTNDDTISGAAHLRKALYMSGWDWAPKLSNMGIFRTVEINAYNVDKIEDVNIEQYHENGEVRVSVSLTTKHGAKNLTAVCELDGQRVTLENGRGEITVKNPKLWWPNGYGEQNLYDVDFYLYSGDTLIDTANKKIGLRDLVLSREDDEYGQEFCFKVNGIKIFAKGANYVPVDSLISRETDERLENLIKDCIFANFNCIRVWGGAYYPRDFFYELCDRYGLVVWQDFMVACANVWMRPEFEREFTLEAIYNVKRIRHHACIGVLCGNNEMEEAVCYWPNANGDDPLVRQDYLKLYEDILPRVCKEHAPYIAYTPSSPTSGGNFNNPQDYTRGDVHFWHVWNGNCEFDEYRKHKFRFCSEYGFESLPNIKTVNTFCPSNERNLLSYTMESHQKHWNGNVKLLKYLAERYKMPKNLEMAVYASQINQATAIKYGVDHFRRCRGYTMGSIYWQLNDCWPVASWSSIDYFGRYKALHYFARRFYNDLSLGIFNEENGVTLNVANETTEPFKGYVKAGVLKNDATPVFVYQQDVSVPALSSLDAVTLSNKDFNGKRDTYFYAELYDSEGNLISRSTELGTKPKHFNFLKPSIDVKIISAEGGAYVVISSDVLAKDVEISFKNHDAVLSDNYFDLPTNEPYTVFAKTNVPASELLSEIQIVSVYDIAD